jgi:hypothetical protein
MTLSEPLQITQLIADVFDRLDIPYLVGGSLASSLHGIPRATQDVDLVADFKPHHVLPFVEALESTFYVDADMIREAMSRRSSFNVIHLVTMFKVDIFILKTDPVSQTEMARRERYQILEEPHRELFIASAEDTILRKLQWFRMGGEVSERQWQDVLGVLEVQNENLDRAYLQHGAQQIGVIDLLERAFQDAGIIQ